MSANYPFIFYAINSQRSGLTFFLRLLTSTPGHILFSVFMGIAFYSIVRLKTGIMLFLISYAYASLAHGLYNSIVFHGLGLFLLGRIHIQKCDTCQRFLATGESLGAVYKYFGSIFQNMANPYHAKKFRISSFFRRSQNKAVEEGRGIVSFSMDDLNATLIQKNREIVENLESKWWFPIKYDFKPKISQDFSEGAAGRGQKGHHKIARGLGAYKVVWVPLLITAVAVVIVLIKLGTAENILPFLFLGFPFVIIFFGILYAVGLMIKDG